VTGKHDWKGRTCVIMASGPGLTQAQVEHVRTTLPKPVSIAVNSTFKRAPWATIVYAGDFMWWKVYHKEVAAACPAAERWTGDQKSSQNYKINRMKCVNRPGLGLQHTHMGGNSGYQAINLAFLFGCRRILLLGFTMREIGGRKHWHEDHPQPLVQKILPDEWRHKFEALAKDLRRENCQVINCDPLSALTCFPMGDIEEELQK
jgi:hypothetical protein